MKYIAAILVAGGVYALLAHHAPVSAPSAAAAASPSPASPETNFLKAPLDRTHEVLDQARSRAQDPALQ
jgi:hypothetical protein